MLHCGVDITILREESLPCPSLCYPPVRIDRAPLDIEHWAVPDEGVFSGADARYPRAARSIRFHR